MPCVVEMRATPSRMSEQPYSYYCYVHESTKCTEVVLANNAAFESNSAQPLSVKAVAALASEELDAPAAKDAEMREWRAKWAKAKRRASDTWRRTIQRPWTSSKKRDGDGQADEHSLDHCNSASKQSANNFCRPRSSSNSAADRQQPTLPAALATPNGVHPKPNDVQNPSDAQWHRPNPTAPRSTQNHFRQAPLSPALPSTPNSSFYECTTSNDESPFDHQNYQPTNPNRMRIGNGTIRDHHAGKLLPATVGSRNAAPLAKPEPVADFDKPAIDNRQFSKQAATISPQQAKRFGSSTLHPPPYQKQQLSPQLHHQKTIRFADEEDDEYGNENRIPEDDPGIMSEAETSATSGTTSAVRRRQMALQRKQDQNYALTNGQMGPARTGDVSPSIQRRDLPHQQFLNVQADVMMAPSPKTKTGVVFLQYQGETKRSALPIGYDGTTKSALYSMDDVRILFLKAFQSEMTPEYLQSSLVKIYIQDPSKTDVFYELEDLNDVKDRSVLKLHESARPNSPPVATVQNHPTQQQATPAIEHRRVMSPLLERATLADPSLASRSSPRRQLANELRSATIGYQQPSHHHQHQSSSMSDDMNYFSEPEFDANGDYRLRKSSSTSNYCISPAYQVDQRRHYGTIDRYYNGSTGSTSRPSYRPQAPPKPERNFGPGMATGGRASMRRSQSPPRVGQLGVTRPNYGHSTDPEDAYGIRGGGNYCDYATSPTSDILLENLYNRPPSVARSGSATPVIDEEARIRMLNMEKQLANLSSLVHSALMSKGVNDTVYKDLEMLRREILGTGGSQGVNGSNGTNTRDDISDSGSISRFSDLSSEKGSYQANADRDGFSNPSTNPPISGNGFSETSSPNGSSGTSVHLAPEVKHTLKNCKRRVGELQSELKNLRRLAQLNAQSSRDVLKDAFDRIKVILNTNKHLHMFAQQAQQQNQAAAGALVSDRTWADQEQDRYRKSMQRVERDLGDLEKQVEEMRQKVISGDRKLRLGEVEAFTEALGQIGRLAAHLKTNFPTLEDRLKQVMSAEMEKVVREEKFLKDEPSRVDTALKRCKKLTNTMVTMKKLAMVQDPAAYYGNANRSQSPLKAAGPQSHDSTVQNGLVNGPTSTPPEYRRALSATEDAIAKTATHSNIAVVAPSPASRPSNSSSGHVLDSLLEELQNVAKTTSIMDSALSNGAAHPPRNEGATEKNGVLGNHSTAPAVEKKVGFADEVQVLPRDDQEIDECDTIKRFPRPGNGYHGSTAINANYGRSSPQVENGVTSILSRNGAANGNYGQQSLGAVGSRRRSASPLTTSTSLTNALFPGLRSHSGTPSSVNSDPSAYHHHHNPPPPPPPRSSSRSMLNAGGNGNASSLESRPRNFDIDELKQQLILSSSPVTASKNPMVTVTATPAAIVQTNAVDEEPRLIKSASSSESVNSQDGRGYHQRHGNAFANDDPDKEQVLLSPPGKPPPPPPPPRNKQEMLEQRQHELMAKQNLYVTKYQF